MKDIHMRSYGDDLFDDDDFWVEMRNSELREEIWINRVFSFLIGVIAGVGACVIYVVS